MQAPSAQPAAHPTVPSSRGDHHSAGTCSLDSCHVLAELKQEHVLGLSLCFYLGRGRRWEDTAGGSPLPGRLAMQSLDVVATPVQVTMAAPGFSNPLYAWSFPKVRPAPRERRCTFSFSGPLPSANVAGKWPWAYSGQMGDVSADFGDGPCHFQTMMRLHIHKEI